MHIMTWHHYWSDLILVISVTVYSIITNKTDPLLERKLRWRSCRKKIRVIEQQDDGALKRMLIEISQSKAALEGLIFFHGTPETSTPSGNCPAGLQRYVTRGGVSLHYLQALYFIPPPSHALSLFCNPFSWSVTFSAACGTIEHSDTVDHHT